jgi:hypothetical protein
MKLDSEVSGVSYQLGYIRGRLKLLDESTVSYSRERC